MKNHISTIGNLTLKYFVFAFSVGFLVHSSKGQLKPVKKSSQNDYVLIPDVNFEKALI